MYLYGLPWRDVLMKRSMASVLGYVLGGHVVHGVAEVADKERCPHIDTILVDSLTTVSGLFFLDSLLFFSAL